MSSAGHVMDMINRIRNNSLLGKSRRDRIIKVKEAYQNRPSKIHKLRKVYISESKLKRIKDIIRIKLEKERKISLLRSLIITTLIVAILGYLLWYYFLHRLF